MLIQLSDWTRMTLSPGAVMARLSVAANWLTSAVQELSYTILQFSKMSRISTQCRRTYSFDSGVSAIIRKARAVLGQTGRREGGFASAPERWPGRIRHQGTRVSFGQ